MKSDSKDQEKSKIRPAPLGHKERLAKWKGLLPSIKSIIWDWGKHHDVPEDVIQDAVQEAQLKLFEKIVQKGKDNDEPSYDIQFAMNRAKNYFIRKHFVYKDRIARIGDIDSFLDQAPQGKEVADGIQEIDEEQSSLAKLEDRESADKEYAETSKHEISSVLEADEDEQYEIGKSNFPLSKKGQRYINRQRISVLDEIKRYLTEEDQRKYHERSISRRRFLDLRDSGALNSRELQIAETIAKSEECFLLDDVQVALGFSDSEFEKLLAGIQRKAKYVRRQVGDWDVYSLRRLPVEKFEKVILMLFHAFRIFNLYRPLREPQKTWTNGDGQRREPKLAPYSERLERALRNPVWGRSFQISL